MKYFVSRQCIWPDGILYVEIALNGIDHASADMLLPKFKNEGQEFYDPREAVEAAISVCDAWRKTNDGSRPSIAVKLTMGMPEPYTYKEIRKWGKAAWERTPKCPRCGDAMGKESWGHPLEDERFCSENCATMDYEAQQKADGADTYEDEAKS